MEGTLTLFGFASTSARLDVLPRSTAWRAIRASLYMGVALIVAPALALIPPHVPWVFMALGVGIFMAWRKWKERFTILSIEGLCPKCGGSLSIPSGTPLRAVLTVPCTGCNHDSRLVPSLPTQLDDGRAGP